VSRPACVVGGKLKRLGGGKRWRSKRMKCKHKVGFLYICFVKQLGT
jgi:hypothetical protein